MKLPNLLSAAGLAAIVVFAVAQLGALGVRTGPPEQRATISMNVPNINGLVVGSGVLLRGVPVGKVTAIEPTAAAATVHFYIDAAHRVPADSMVRLDNLSALGETYVGLFPVRADGPMLADGDRIAAEAIAVTPTISDLAVSVGRLLGQADPDRLSALVAEADVALPDPEAVLPNLARAATLLRAEATGADGRGRELLRNAQTLLRDAGFAGPALASLAPDIDAAGANLAGVFAGAMNLVLAGSPEALERFRDYLSRIQRFLDSRSPDVKVLAETLLPNVRAIGSALGGFDTGRMLDNMLRGIPPDGAIDLRVNVLPPR